MQSLPVAAPIVGASLELRPLAPGDFEALYHVASDPLIWAQHPSPTRYQEAVFREWFKDALMSDSVLVVIDRSSHQVVGSSRYYEFNEKAREVAIGYTFLAREKWGGGANGELKRLMLRHAFQWVDTVWFHIAAQNIRSQRAMEKIGGKFSHSSIKQLAHGTQENFFYKVERATFEHRESVTDT
ncbi:N-acetyltransferase [Pseudomonas sp. BCA14]|uniref:GNAT family N-acetyltransferase n=1 Tax=unclassified Pseudomonas TaxID=196821 RepID=UPI00106E97A5|nr:MULTISPECIES: GNAT family N-acetyltransferase [unclassified Pseudomonas]TFF14327.1 N-acetyltransferase [Pseudomonas sp. JMN1]TFF14989.1 N-acetyltransferase [Pseudomonas sp. BCA17]TFF31395.1 N-acetyltransferase [Pseudomonas sp. BCA14]TFF32349.1 N-acetyltransferase [Pseudomonas sp. BCA13]